MTAVGAGEILTEVRIPLRPGARQRAREGRAPRRRLRDRGRVGRGVDRRRHDRRRRHRAQRGRADDDRRSRGRRSCCAARRRRRSCSRRRARSPPTDCSPERRRPRTGRLQAPPRRRAHQTRAAPRRPPARCTRRPEQWTSRSTINGEHGHARRRAAAAARPLHPRHAGLTGTHWGCDTSNCGACVVLMDGKPVKSCTTLAAMCEGHEIRTVESLEVDGELDPVQQGFHELHALHCGFCTPGMMMASRALLDENPNPTERGDPHRDLRRRSAAAPATRTSSPRSAGPPSTKPPQQQEV